MEANPSEPLLVDVVENENGSSNAKAFLNLIKSFLGAGILSIPYAFNHSGLLLGIIAYVVVAILSVWTMVEIVRCKQEVNRLRRKRGLPPAVTYSAVAEYITGMAGRRFVDFIVILLQLAFCGGFIIVIFQNMNTLAPSVDELWVALALTPVLITLCWVRWIKDLWAISFFGVLVYVAGVCGSTFYYGIDSLVKDGYTGHDKKGDELVMWDFEDLMLFVGTAVYSMEGILLILPIEGSMKDPSKAMKVVVGGNIIYAAQVISFGGLAYASGYGHCSLITDCLDEGPLKTILIVAVCISLSITYPLTMYAATETVEELFLDPKSPNAELKRKGLRLACVAFTLCIALVIPDFAVFTDLIGGICIAPIGFVFPSLMYIILFGQQNKLHTLDGAMSVIVLIFGIGFTGYGSYSSISSLV